MSQPKKLTLANIGGGELALLVEREMSAICENIADPNIKAEAVRSLKVEIKIKPDKRRQTAEITYQVKSAVPGIEANKTTAFIGMDQGELGLYGVDLRQDELPFAGKVEEPTVTEIKQVAPPTVEKAAFAPPMTNN